MTPGSSAWFGLHLPSPTCPGGCHKHSHPPTESHKEEWARGLAPGPDTVANTRVTWSQRSYVACLFADQLIFCVFWCFNILKTLSSWEETAQPCGSQFLELAKDPAYCMPVTCKLSRATSSLWSAHPKKQYSSALVLSVPGAWQLETNPMTEPTKIIQTSQS